MSVVGFSSADYGPIFIDQAAGATGNVVPVASAWDSTATGVPTASTGSVLGTSTTSTTSTAPSGDSEYEALLKIENPNPIQQERIAELENQVQDISAEQRSAIESGYGAYEAELDAMLNEGLPGQQSALEAGASAQLAQGLEDLGFQKSEGEAQLTKQETKTKEEQKRSLKDIAANIRNSFMAGNVFLGAGGAGDSSAARMYSYALTKLGSKQRGDIMKQSANIMNEIRDRSHRLSTIYNTEKNKLQQTYNQRIAEVQQWFYEQQNALRGAKGELAVKKGQDLASLSQTLLNQALSEINFIKEQAAAKTQMLDQWAMNNASTIQQLQQNMAAVSGYNPTQPKAQPIVGAPQMSGGNIFAPSAYASGGGGSVQTKDEDLFKSPGISSGGGSW